MNVVILEAIAGNFSVTCPPGGAVRILAGVWNLSGLADGDMLSAAFSQSSRIFCSAASNPLLIGNVTVSGFIGGELTQPMVDQVVVATGFYIYKAAPTHATFALPDCWWPFDFTVNTQLDSGGGAVLSAFIAYEVRATARIAKEREKVAKRERK